MGARMEKNWSQIDANANAFTGAETFLSAGLGGSGAFTVLRMIGGYTIAPSTATVAADACRITVGIGVVSTDAFTLGASAMPDPGAEPEYPWLYHKDHRLFFGGTSVDPASMASTARVDFDIRSMRKLKARETLAMIVEYTNIGGDPPIRVDLSQTRVLSGF